MDVILIGAGRYGNNLIGQKYSKGEYYGAKLGVVVDPNIDNIKQQQNYNLKNAKTYKDIKDVKKCDCEGALCEVALVPKLVYDVYQKVIQKGIKKIILPKPVTSDFDTFEKMENLAKEHNAKAVVASNWHYSDITNFTKAILKTLKGEKVKTAPKEIESELSHLDDFNYDFTVEKAKIEYSKKNEVLTIDPPSQEMPHALQIVHSTGLMDLDDAEILMDSKKQSKSAVNVTLIDKKSVKDDIEINSDLQKGDKTDLKRERVLKIYLDDDDKDADIICDYDAQFENSICTKTPSIEVDITKNGIRRAFKKEIIEDNMDKMYENMFDYFNKKSSDALTLEDYEPIARKISQIQALWEDCVKK